MFSTVLTIYSEENLESAQRRRALCAGTFSAAEDKPVSQYLPEELTFLHAEDILDKFPDMPRKQRETAILQEYPAIFIDGIGWTLKDGYPHKMRAADYREISMCWNNRRRKK
jgi:asparagine synthetase A